MNTVGIFGGTFDPVHIGHIRLAEQVQRRLALDQLQFLPCAIPVHRDLPLASDEDRLKMLELAISGRSHWLVNTVELDRDGRSYMVDSLQIIQRQQPGDKLVLLLGVDAFNAFHRWKAPEAILALAHLVVCHRPGSLPDKTIFSERHQTSLDLLRSAEAGGIFHLDIDENHCSSSGVRQSLAQNGSAPDCLLPAVYHYIQQHQLYEVTSE